MVDKRLVYLILAFIIAGAILFNSCSSKSNKKEQKHEMVTKVIDITYMDGFRDTIEVEIPDNYVIYMRVYDKWATLPSIVAYDSSGAFNSSKVIEGSYGVIRYKILNQW